MIVLSLFDGISCGQLALQRAGIMPSVYFASEIDAQAIKVTQKNFPKTIQLGDVKKIKFEDFAGSVDLLMGGSPCQDLSIARNDRKGLEGEKSGLFFYYLKALRTIKPRYFLLENNASMSKENREIITELLGVEPVMIDSALVSAQTRKRLYWCNWDVETPRGKGIKVNDILERGWCNREKSYSLTVSYSRCYGKQSYLCRRYFGKRFGQIVFTDEKSYDIARDMYRQNPYFETEMELVRPLTCIECERLQTLPDGYTEGISEIQRKEVLGNCWTVDVITHILRGIK